MKTAQHQIDIVRDADAELSGLPGDELIAHWASETLAFESCQRGPSELAIKIVSESEIRELNHRYRQMDKTTNVLSFPMGDLPAAALEEVDLLGDIAICAQVVKEEAHAQGKSLEAHFAHMIVHGVLHLIGYDHIEDQDAEEMERLEVRLLASLEFENPYKMEKR